MLLLFAIFSSVSLVMGAIIGNIWSPSKRITGVMLAFASGALITALSFELFEKAFKLSGIFNSSIGLIVGAISYVLLDKLVDTWIKPSKGSQIKNRERFMQTKPTIGYSLVVAVQFYSCLKFLFCGKE